MPTHAPHPPPVAQRRATLVALATGMVGGALLVGSLVIATRPVVSAGDDEGAWLGATYGPARHSEHREEWILRDAFGDAREGFFLDVGAHHPRLFSNTFYLEHVLGWSGIAVEPLVEFEEAYRRERPRTRFRAFFASDTSDGHATLFRLDSNPLVTSSQRTFTERWGSEVEQTEVPTITLTDLLTAEGVSSLDFLSMDIELAEPAALAGFDIRRFPTRLVCIEAHPEVRQAILDYFHRHGYVIVGRYLRADSFNLWFRPAGTQDDQAPTGR